jgi:hypothetical protein
MDGVPCYMIEEDKMEALDEFIYSWYRKRVHYRNRGGHDCTWEDDYFGMSYEAMLDTIKYQIKPLAKQWGLYPYNQEVVKYP